MRLLLHICCGNCAAFPVQLLRKEGHRLDGFWFNPNIHPAGEYELRRESLRKLAEQQRLDVLFHETCEPETFFKMFPAPLPAPPVRCRSCYALRLEKTASMARSEGYEAFTTSLLISPYQDVEHIRAAGEECAERHNVMFLFRDFRPYFRQSMALAQDAGVYRQKYCGCIFSKEERKRNEKLKIKS